VSHFSQHPTFSQSSNNTNNTTQKDKTMTRTHGVTVKLIDPVKLATAHGAADPNYFLTSGIIENAAGQMRTINDEGVQDTGQVMNADGEWIDGDYYTVYTWSGYLVFSEATIRECLSGETVDLADFVRVFGDRLERNYGIAFRWATS
jgi:hypothetical protein